jgi:PAS domain-containing protein
MDTTSLSKNTLLALINQLQDAAFAIEDGYFVFVNQRLLDLYRYSESELLSQPFINFVHEDNKTLFSRPQGPAQHCVKRSIFRFV